MKKGLNSKIEINYLLKYIKLQNEYLIYKKFMKLLKNANNKI